ncbi:MAG: exodeoxyribonuclease VII large subunit, partial [Gammaproteobacteria bacterium]|nr:exodeoxyribonuclease VII large subunit [Gammaproteobacteria bacterium]
QLSDTRHKIAILGRTLNSVSPLATLDRGYAIVKREATGDVLLDAANVATGEDIRARLSRGEIIATVKKIIT